MPAVGSGGGPVWKATLQPERAQVASCTCCKRKFDPGTLRISRARASSQRYAHIECLGITLGPPADVEGFSELPDQIVASLEPYVTQAVDVNMGSSQATIAADIDMVASPASAEHNDADEENAIAADFAQSQILKNMSWWDSHGEDLLLNQACTLTGTPSQLNVEHSPLL